MWYNSSMQQPAQFTTQKGRTMTAPDDRITGAIEQLKVWAAEKEIPFEAVLEALDEDTDGSLPPFHRSVVWADIYDANGIKFHVVVREGATHSSLMDNLLVVVEVNGVSGPRPTIRRARSGGG